MKQKNKAQKTILPVMSSELKSEMRQFGQRLEKKFATKNDLRKALQATEGRIDENAKQYHDEILTKLDGVMGELKTIREESAIGAHQVFELKEEVDDHEKRITHLEESRLPA